MRRPVRWLIGAALFLTSPAAHAHMLNTGLGPFYDGLAHLFVSPEDLLPVIAIALLGGLRGANFGRTVLFVLPVAWLAGSFAGRFSPVPLTLPALTAALTVILGGLVAADRPLSVTLVAGCGLFTWAASRPAQRDRVSQAALDHKQLCGSFRRALCRGIVAGGTGNDGAGGVGASGSSRGRELDCRHWASHAGMDFTRVLRLQLAKTKKIDCNMNSYTVI